MQREFFVFAMVLFLFACATHGNSPVIVSFTYSPSSKFQPRQTGELRFRCLTRYADSIQFRKDGRVLSRANDARIFKRGNELVIRNVNYARDDGDYQCFVKNNKGAVLSGTLNIKIAVLGEFSNSFNIANTKKVPFVVGKAHILNCPPHSYTYPEKVIWGNIPITGQPRKFASDKRRYQLSNGSLFFTKVEESDVTEINNQYQGLSCFLYHNGPYRQSARYMIERVASIASDFKPKFIESLSRTTKVRAGDEVSYYCAAGGSPVPKITWRRPGNQIIKNDAEFQISPSGNQLTLKAAYKRHEGVYKCEVRNRVGNDVSEGRLIVEDPISWRITIQDTTVNPYATAKFTCSANGPQTISYQWFQNGNPIDKTNSSYSVNGGLLEIKNIKPGVFGMIQCFAKYNKDVLSAQAFLNVRGAVIPTPNPDEGDGDKLHFGYYVLIGGGVLTAFAASSVVIYLRTR